MYRPAPPRLAPEPPPAVREMRAFIAGQTARATGLPRRCPITHMGALEQWLAGHDAGIEEIDE